MSPTQVVVEGTLKPDGTLEMDQKPKLPPGRVRVVLERMPEPSPEPRPGYWEVLQQIWREQAASGYRGRTAEEIDADINAMRDGWEERMQELEKIHEEARRARGQS